MTDLDRRVGLLGATAIGIGSMVGAGLFVVLPEAVAVGGRAVVWALALAGLIALCNAWSSARLAARYPQSGGTYVYGRERLGTPWGVLAGGAFVIGKTASLAVMATAIGRYVWPGQPEIAAVAALVLVTAVNLAGVQRSTTVMIGVVAVVLAVVGVTTATLLTGPSAGGVVEAGDKAGVLEAAGLLFFAFAGYARLATIGDEVVEPRTTIPRAIGIAVAVVALVYGASLAALLHALGPDLVVADAPFVEALDATDHPALARVVAVVAVVAAAGALLSLGLGVSRTAFAMARDGHLPRRLAAVSATRVPWVAEVVTAGVAAALVLTIDLRPTIALSSVCVLIYYAVANASAWTLGGTAGRTVAATGLIGCLVLAGSLVPL